MTPSTLPGMGRRPREGTASATWSTRFSADERELLAMLARQCGVSEAAIVRAGLLAFAELMSERPDAARELLE